jgi:hypothetical protein
MQLTYWQYFSGFGPGAKPLQIKDLRKANWGYSAGTELRLKKQHAVPVAEKTISQPHSVLIGGQYPLASRECTDQHQ